MANIATVIRSLFLHRESSDGELLLRYALDQDQEAFSALVDRYGGLVLGVCHRLLGQQDSEDCFQATFLILAKKASTLKAGSLGNWLHTVALNTALNARKQFRRRQQRERQVETMPEPQTSTGAWGEIKELLDVELNRLPARFRQPLLLCYLMGKTNSQAAEALGCSRDTVRRRVEEALALLKRRLAKHGIAFTGGVLVAALADNAARVSVPLALASSTVAYAAALHTGRAVLPAPVATLIQGGLRQMFYANLKAVAVVLIAVVVLSATAGVFTHMAMAGKGSEQPSLPAIPQDPPAARLKKLTGPERANIMAMLQAAPAAKAPSFGERLEQLLDSLLKSKKPDAQVVDGLFMAVFVRLPSEAEKRNVSASLAKAENREQFCQDLLWQMLNSSEFAALHKITGGGKISDYIPPKLKDRMPAKDKAKK